ncbi:hypothetical protein RCH39_24510 [Klebsiella pneumoniae subsp. pneumoniae]|nr:hypothetical protein [Klebsiella pneumoniae]MDQ7889132.1 hypothetical protein [Klebsiella pneumoniae subsp. pneumoniae]
MAEGFSEWLPVISTLAGGVLAFGAALVVNKVNHRYALEREARAAAERQRHEMKVAQDKLERERYFISTELIFQLERFGEDCVAAACDYMKAASLRLTAKYPLSVSQLLRGTGGLFRHPLCSVFVNWTYNWQNRVTPSVSSVKMMQNLI